MHAAYSNETESELESIYTETSRDWKSDFETHYDRFGALVVLMEEYCDHMDDKYDKQCNNKDDLDLLYLMATRIIIDLGTDYEHLAVMTVTFWMLCNLEKHLILMESIISLHTQMTQLSNSLQEHYFAQHNSNNLNELSLLQLHEYLSIERTKFTINVNLAKAYASKLQLNESLNTIQSTLALAHTFNESIQLFNDKFDRDASTEHTALIEGGVVLQRLSRLKLSETYSFESKVYLRMNDFEKALGSINKAIESTFTFYTLQKPSQIDLNAVDEKSELSEQERVTKFIETECFEYYIERGLAYSNLGNHGKAYENDYKATQVNPTSIEAWNNRAFSLYELGRHAECIEDCNFALKTLNPDEFDRGLLIGNRGLAEYKLRLFNASINDLNECISLCPQSRLARETLKKIWDEIVETIYESAKLLVDMPLGIAVIISNYGVGIEYHVLDSCNRESNIVYHDISDF